MNDEGIPGWIMILVAAAIVAGVVVAIGVVSWAFILAAA